MAGEDFFSIYVKQCRELHEKNHPGAFIDEDKFKQLALEHWQQSSACDKKKFRAQHKEKFDSFKDFCQAKRGAVMAANPGISIKKALEILENMWKEHLADE